MTTTDHIASQRAQMPTGTNRVLDRRTLEHDNKNLLPWLQSGMVVLDVGCGSGAITSGISEKVGATGNVIGIDTSEELIAQARNRQSISNLSFVVADIYDYETSIRFELISSARTLQWLRKPEMAITKMKELLAPNGIVSILDYNHEKIEWSPSPPPSMLHFYAAFLQWRTDAGMNNRIADSLASYLSNAGLETLRVTDESEFTQRGEKDFYEAAVIWKTVAETRGKQLVSDGYIAEEERLTAIEDYDYWLTTDAVSMKMYLHGVTGRRKEV